MNRIKSIVNQLQILIFIIGLSSIGFAQNPNWEVDENEYEYTMTFVASLNLDGVELSSTNDQVAAFVGSEIRGVTNLTYVASADRYFAYLTAFANTNGESLSFKIYDSVNDEVRDVLTTVVFEINAHQGDIFQSVSIADPQLSTEANIVSFSFEGVTAVNTLIDNENTNVAINVDQSQTLTALTPVFTLSNGATAFVDGIEQISNNSTFDFSSTITYRIRSEDNSVINDWTVNVVGVDTDLVYFKRDVVCYQNGAIKVETTESFTVPVELYFNNVLIASQNFVSGEVLFQNLDANTYEVRIGNIIKNIDVELRTN